MRHCFTAATFLLLGIGWTASHTNAQTTQPVFSNHTLPVGSGGPPPTIIDFDTDGDLDVSLGRTMAPGNGAGSFGATVGLPFVASWAVSRADDVTGDRINDVVLVTNPVFGPGTLQVQTAIAGTFMPSFTIPTGAGAVAMELEDVDGDGRRDAIIVTSDFPPNSGEVSLHLGVPGGYGAQTVLLHPSGGRPTDLVIIDVDVDGDWDIVTANTTTNDVAVFINSGTGTFPNPTTFSTGGTSPSQIASADFNGDGYRDVVVVDTATGASAFVLLNTGAGGFGAPIAVPVSQAQTDVVAGDFDGDGNADIVTTQASSGTVVLLPGDGAGGFGTAIEIDAGTSPGSLAAGFLNGDGDLDLVTVHAGRVGVYLSDDTTGALQIPGLIETDTTPGAAPGISQIVEADMNNDGSVDLVIGDLSESDVEIWLGDGSGAFTFASAWFIGGNALAVTTGDYDNDGNTDFAAATGSNLMRIFFGNGAGGTITNSVRVLGSPSTGSDQIASGDVDGDGVDDIVVCTNTATFFLPGGSSPANIGPAASSVSLSDLDLDGDLDVVLENTGLQVLLNLGGSFSLPTSFGVDYDPAPAVGDVNGDGIPDAVGRIVAFGVTFNSIDVLLGDGTGGFTTTTPFGALSGAVATRLIDVDGDADLDILGFGTLVFGIPVARLWTNDGTGTFALDESFRPRLTDIDAGEAIDTNGDGRFEILAGGRYDGLATDSHGVTILFPDDCGGTAQAFGAGCDVQGLTRPHLGISGCATPGGQVTYRVQNARPISTGFLFQGTSTNPIFTVPLGSGCFFYPGGTLLPFTPSLAIIAPVTGVGAGQGQASLTLPVPLNTPTPSSVTAQVLIVDPVNPSTLLGATNGVILNIN